MKTALRFLFSLALTLFMVSALSAIVADSFGTSPIVSYTASAIVMVVVFSLGYAHRTIGVYRNGVEVEFWVNYIIERFWKDNQFLKHAFNEDQYVIGGKIVHIPQPGSKPVVVKGRSTFPAAAVRRTDTDILYALEEYSTDPTHIQDAEKVELSYSKIDSVLGDHSGVINETIANDMIIKWLTALPGANIVDTTGSSVTAKVPGQTGNRKAMLHTDLKAARLKMNLLDVPGTDRYALLEENMADEFTESLSTTQYKDFSQYYDAKTGVIGKLYGFNIMTRSSVGMAAAALDGGNLSVNALGASVAATNNTVSICWQKNAVTRAMGEVKFFEKLNDPQYYGDVYSALMRMGGRRRRADNAGVIAIKSVAA